MESRLIDKEVTITNKDSWHYGDWGIIKSFDGEYYEVAMFGDENDMPIFSRDEFKVKRNAK